MDTLIHESSEVALDPGVSLEEAAGLKREIEMLRARLSELSGATLRIIEDPDLDTVLQGVIDGARSLTGARYGALLILDHLGGIEALITSGITYEEAAAITVEPKGLGLLGYLNELRGPLRLRDIAAHHRSIGFPKGHPPMKSFLGTPIIHRGERLGNIYLTEKEHGEEFTPEDEESLTVFASHAATAIFNARAYQFERQAKADLEALNERFLMLCEAVRVLSESLDVDSVLDRIVTSARSLTGARNGLITTLDESGRLVDFYTSGFTPEDREVLLDVPRGPEILDHFHNLPRPLRVPDLTAHIRNLGFSDALPPLATALSVPVYFRDVRVGNLYLANKEGGAEFTEGDEELMSVLASQAAVAIANARAYQSERQAKADMEALNERFLMLCEAVRVLSESLDVDSVLDRIVTSARSLTGARNGLITTLDESGQLVNFYPSGFTPEDREVLLGVPRGPEILDHFHNLPRPLRVPDLTAHIRNLGFSDALPPLATALSVPVYFHDVRVGNLYLANKEGGAEFTEGDEELMSVLASQAAVAIANARAYQSERQAKADMEALVDTSPVGVMVFDAKTLDLVSFNQETRRIVRGLSGLGRSREALFSVMSFRRPDGRKIPHEELPTARAIRDGNSVRAEEIIIDLPGDQTIRTIINATPVFSEEGEVVSVITTMQDMTPLERTERLRAEFVGMVSHELRTPLAAIKGSAATVLGASSALDSEEMRHFFRVIDDQADRMRGLISDLLDTAQIEAGTLSVDSEPADMADLVEEARRAFLRGGATNVIEADLPPGLPRVEVDRQRMGQVLNNLFAYASRHSPYMSTIRMSASVDDVYVSISVADESRDVSGERLRQLFRRFSPVDGEDRYGQSAGEGLGLIVCRGIVEAHGGRIWAESIGPGLGTRFTFTVPSVEEAARGAAANSGWLLADAERTEGARTRVLVLDDEPHILLHLRNTLREAGYASMVTDNPKEAHRLIETDKPHLILLNPTLADPVSEYWTGEIELMDDIREFTDAPVIFMSGQASDDDIARAFDVGADDYILKPFSPTELVARIRAALRRQSAQEPTQTREPYLLGDLMIDYQERRVTLAGRPVQLTSTEYKLLSDLSANAGRVLSHDQLLRRVWGPGYEGDTQPVRTFVKNLRRKLGDDPRNPAYIFTEPRVGYRMAKSGGGGARRTPDARRMTHGD